MKTIIHILMIATFFTGMTFAQNTATITLPDTSASYGDLIGIPIKVTTTSTIGLAQFTVEYDSSIIQFDSAVTGGGVTNFMVSLINSNLPFSVTTAGTSENVLVQLSGGGMGTFSGTGVEVAIIYFKVITSTGMSPLNFDQIAGHTFLTTTGLQDITGSNITFSSGQVNVLYTDIHMFNNSQIPVSYSLHQNYPNPFNPTTTIEYSIQKSEYVRLFIYDVLGQRVKTLVDRPQQSGWFRVTWDGTNDLGEKVSSGLYLCQFRSSPNILIKKMTLIQ